MTYDQIPLLDLADAPADPRFYTPGTRYVLAWSKDIHGFGERHNWAKACCDLLDGLGRDAVLPPFPSPFPSTRESRAATLVRIYWSAS